MMILSESAKTALVCTEARIGARVPRLVGKTVLGELQASGLMGETGLTRAGLTVRERIMNAKLDVAF